MDLEGVTLSDPAVLRGYYEGVEQAVEQISARVHRVHR